MRNLTGSYPWRIDDDYSTIVSVTNVGERPARFQVDIRYPGGPYSIKPQQLEPGQTAVFDLRKMRDEQAPDRTGKALAVDRGQFHWSVVATPGEAHLIGRAEVVSRSARVASSYSCPTCCPDSGPFGGFNPNSYTLYIDGSIATSSSGEYYDCYWHSYPTTMWFSSLSTWDPAVATFAEGTEDLHGEGAGYTYAVGTYDLIEWWTDNMDCYQHYYPAQSDAPVEVVCAVPTNFHQTTVSDAGNGTMHVEYAWDSSTGNLSDLGQCTVNEKVDYNSSDLPFQSPPFPAGINPPNPTILPVPPVAGTSGTLQDNHSTPGTFVKPYSEKTITATQRYRYTCPCANSGQPVTLYGPLSIVRSVTFQSAGQSMFPFCQKTIVNS